MSDYESNLALIAQQPTVKPAHAGILASAVAGHGRILEREIETRRNAKTGGRPSQHVGGVGQRLDLKLEVQRVNSKPTDYGMLHIISMRDEDNNLFVWKTGSTSAAPGDRLSVRGTIQKHDEFRGELQTVLSRCKCSPVVLDPSGQPAPVTKRRKARDSKKVAPPFNDDLRSWNETTWSFRALPRRGRLPNVQVVSFQLLNGAGNPAPRGA